MGVTQLLPCRVPCRVATKKMHFGCRMSTERKFLRTLMRIDTYALCSITDSRQLYCVFLHKQIVVIKGKKEERKGWREGGREKMSKQRRGLIFPSQQICHRLSENQGAMHAHVNPSYPTLNKLRLVHKKQIISYQFVVGMYILMNLISNALSRNILLMYLIVRITTNEYTGICMYIIQRWAMLGSQSWICKIQSLFLYYYLVVLFILQL